MTYGLKIGERVVHQGMPGRIVNINTLAEVRQYLFRSDHAGQTRMVGFSDVTRIEEEKEMDKKEISIGTRVRYRGQAGQIIGKDWSMSDIYVFESDHYHPLFGTAKGRCVDGYGAFVYLEDVELIEKEEKMTPVENCCMSVPEAPAPDMRPAYFISRFDAFSVMDTERSIYIYNDREKAEKEALKRSDEKDVPYYVYMATAVSVITPPAKPEATIKRLDEVTKVNMLS
jgi:hypothetical protein